MIHGPVNQRQEPCVICLILYSKNIILTLIISALTWTTFHQSCQRKHRIPPKRRCQPITVRSVKTRNTKLYTAFRLKIWKLTWNKICALLGYYASSCGNCLPTFRDNVWVPSSRVKIPSRKVPEERRSRKHRDGSLKSRLHETNYVIIRYIHNQS
jgi:hypothetical protein